MPDRIECPFCGCKGAATVQQVQARPRPGMTTAGYASHCEIHKGGCGASGPITMAPELARQAWGNRADDFDLSFYKRTAWSWRRPWKLPGTELVKARGRVRPL